MADSKITVFSLPAAFGLSSASPFCVKVETYLRMVDQSYELVYADPRKSPRGKFPWVEHDGAVVTDSELIVEHFEQHLPRGLDTGLSKEDAARGHLIRKTIEESLYFLVLHQRWARDDNFDQLKKVFEGLVPRLMLPLVQRMARRAVLKSLDGQGTGRRETAEVDRLGCQDLDALAHALGKRPWFLGDQPRTVDACALSFLMQLAAADQMSGPFRDHMLSHENLRDYVARGAQAFWPECEVLKSVS